MKVYALAVLAFLGCGDNVRGEDPLPPGPDGWAIQVDMSGLDRYVPAGTATWAVGGHARSTLPLTDAADVAGTPVPYDDGDFLHGEVSVHEGVNVVPIFARDVEDHQRQAHRALLSAHFLPEGDVNDRMMTLTLSDQLLASINALVREQAGSVDLAAQIEGQEIDNGQCKIRMTEVTHGPLVLELQKRMATQLWFHFNLPNLLIRFAGTCTDPTTLLPIGVNGRIGGTIDIASQLTAKSPVAPDHCVPGFDHSTPAVAITNWIYEINGDNPATTILIRTLAPKSEDVRQQMITELRTATDQGLTQGLSNVELLKQEQQFELVAGKPIVMSTCVAALGPENGKIVLRLAGTVAGTSATTAPGAPLMAPQAPVTVDNEFLLDTGLMSMMTFSLWKDGIFNFEQADAFDLGLIALLVPGLGERYPEGTQADIRVEGELPAYITAVPADSATGGDMRIEIGDLMLYVSVDGEQIFKIGLHLRIDFDFVAEEGELRPKVVGSLAEATVLEELLDADDNAIELAIEAGIGSGLGGLVGGGAGGLPEIIPGLGRITDVRADAGGRYLRVTFVPGATAAQSLLRFRR